MNENHESGWIALHSNSNSNSNSNSEKKAECRAKARGGGGGRGGEGSDWAILVSRFFCTSCSVKIVCPLEERSLICVERYCFDDSPTLSKSTTSWNDAILTLTASSTKKPIPSCLTTSGAPPATRSVSFSLYISMYVAVIS